MVKNKQKKLNKKTKSRSQFIGKGSYGCVFKPSIPCKKDLKKKKTRNRGCCRADGDWHGILRLRS